MKEHDFARGLHTRFPRRILVSVQIPLTTSAAVTANHLAYRTVRDDAPQVGSWNGYRVHNSVLLPSIQLMHVERPSATTPYSLVVYTLYVSRHTQPMAHALTLTLTNSGDIRSPSFSIFPTMQSLGTTSRYHFRREPR